MNFREIADRVHVVTCPAFSVNCTLIVGQEAAVLVDTSERPSELRDAVRRMTSLPLILVNTHFHFDHCFGNDAFDNLEIWAHPHCAQELRERGEKWRLVWEAEYDIDLSGVTIKPPDHLVSREHTLHIGGKDVVLSHHGRGHTAGDLITRVDNVLIAGDLVEQGAPPAFEDSFPLEWPEVLAELLTVVNADTIIVPGHGDIVDRAFLKAQHDILTKLDWLIRDGHADDAPVERVAAASPLNLLGEQGIHQSNVAVRRGYAQLAGVLEA